MLPPVVVGLYFQDPNIWPFISTFVLTGGLGLLGMVFIDRNKAQLKQRHSFLVLVVFWLVFSVVSALPFSFSEALNISYVDSLFEAISGITTTGATIIVDVDHTPKIFLYYRAQLNFVGGLGIIVLAMALLPSMGIGGARLYQSEAPGASRDERISPRLADTARNLWVIYTLLGVACTLSFAWAGMGWFDALCHAMSTVSLGGFSTRTDSIAHFNNPAIEWVAGIFTLLAAVNFALYFRVWHQRNLRALYRDDELRFFLSVFFFITVFVCGYLYWSNFFPLYESIYHGFFQTASIMADNGLVTDQFPNWPVPVALVLILSSFFGGCVGSTGGGIKALRFLMLFRQSKQQLDEAIHPHGIFPVKVGKRVAHPEAIQSVWALFFVYIVFTIIFVVGLVLTGEDILTAFGSVAACINNMGVGYGDTAVTFNTLTHVGKWLMCAAMLFGRLEIFPILIVLSKRYWSF
jgi:trk system potassium uptake protein TrkH